VKVSALSQEEMHQLMMQQGVWLKIPPFTIRIQSPMSAVSRAVCDLYADYTLEPFSVKHFADFHIRIARPAGLRYWYKPQALFYFDNKEPFKPLPYSQAFPFFEWGLNWCIAQHIYKYLIIHSAVVEKNGLSLLLSGYPGAGKSTLCAALISCGWRLLSDEMAIVDLTNAELLPLVRPVSLKNQAIDVIKLFAPYAHIGELFLDTAKGTVAHLKPPSESVAQCEKRARARWVVFPKYQDQAETQLTPVSKGRALLRLAENSFNYNVIGQQGFEILCDLLECSDCYDFQYSRLNEAVELFSDLAERR